MNSPFVLEQSAALATRAASADDPVATLYRHGLQREPSPTEFERAAAYLESGGTLADLAQALYSANEFRYID